MPAPATSGDLRRASVILVGHGSASCPNAGEVLARHAEALRVRGIYRDVHPAVLVGAPSLATAVAAVAGDPVLIVPVLMSDGLTVRRTLPRALSAPPLRNALGGRSPVLYPPIGLHPRLAELIVARARERLLGEGIDPGAASALLIAHGSSRDLGSRRAVDAQVGWIRGAGRFRRVTAGFLEQAPGVAEALAGLDGAVVAVGLFAGGGKHASEDVGPLLGATGRADVLHLGPIGCDEGIPAVIDAVIAEGARAAPRCGDYSAAEAPAPPTRAAPSRP